MLVDTPTADAPCARSVSGARDGDLGARWSAVVSADPRVDGAFVYAVRTTGIYCRPTCPAPRPRRGNVRFFDAPGLAEAAGFRPCKRCRPAEATASVGGDTREARGAVLFVDMVDASTAMARAAPREAAEHAIAFFATLQREVVAHGGRVHKFLGDGALVWFEHDCDSAANEAQAALACALALRDRTGVRDDVRQGLHYGRVGVGTVSTETGPRLELIGHTLNAAKRLEHATRRFGARLLVSDDAVRASRCDADKLGLTRWPRSIRLRGCRAVAAWAG